MTQTPKGLPIKLTDRKFASRGLGPRVHGNPIAACGNSWMAGPSPAKNELSDLGAPPQIRLNHLREPNSQCVRRPFQPRSCTICLTRLRISGLGRMPFVSLA